LKIQDKDTFKKYLKIQDKILSYILKIQDTILKIVSCTTLAPQNIIWSVPVKRVKRRIDSFYRNR